MIIPVPERPKIYHIVHVDRLKSIIDFSGLASDAVMRGRPVIGTSIGMTEIKERRLRELKLSTRPNLYVGQCVPFYFCPRSVMLYLIYKRNPALAYQGGQEPIIHLEADLYDTINWAKGRNLRWAFTTSNAGAYHFEDFARTDQLKKIDWEAVQAKLWMNTSEHPNRKELKQAEFLIEKFLPWQLITRIGVYSRHIKDEVPKALCLVDHRPLVEIKPDWYY